MLQLVDQATITLKTRIEDLRWAVPAENPTLTALETDIEEFAGGPLPLDGPKLAQELQQVRRMINQLELAASRRAAAYAQTDHWKDQGYQTPMSWMRHECHTSYGAAVGAIAVGMQAEALPESVSAMNRGSIGFTHLTLMAETAQALQCGPVPTPFDERPLLDLATIHLTSRFRKDCAHVRHAASERAFLATQNADHPYRELKLSRIDGGGLSITGWFDAEGGATILTALDPLARPAGKGDLRCLKQRNADALVELAGHGLDSAELPTVGGQRPHLNVTATVETLHNLPGAPAGDLEFGGAVAATTVQRLACDSMITRVVVDARSQVIDVGRTRRFPHRALRVALRARDQGCIWPGCDRTASWTSAHHLLEWVADHGRTDLDNMVSLCRRHHWMVHEGGWRLIRRPDGRVIVLAPGFDYSSGRSLRNNARAGPELRE